MLCLSDAREAKALDAAEKSKQQHEKHTSDSQSESLLSFFIVAPHSDIFRAYPNNTKADL